MPDYQREGRLGLEHRKRHNDHEWHWRQDCPGWPRDDESHKKFNGHPEPYCRHCKELDPGRQSHR